MKHLRLGVMGLLMLTMVGCAGFGRHTDQAARRSSLMLEPGSAEKLGYSINWAGDLSLPADQHIANAQVLDDLIIVIERPASVVSAVTVREGHVRWHRIVGETTQQLYKALRYEDHIYVNSPTQMYAMKTTDGTIDDQASLARTVASGPVHYKNYAIFGAVSGRVFAHRLKVGRPWWQYQLVDQILVSPALLGNRVFVVDGSGVYALLNAETGAAIYRNQTYGPVSASPTSDDDTIYMASEDQSLYALSKNSDQERWRYFADVPLTDSPMVVGDTVLQPLGQNAMVALDKRTGDERWRLDYRAVPVLERDGQLLLHTGNKLQLVDAQTGRLASEISTRPIKRILHGPEGSLILISPTGDMLRLNPLP